MSSIKIQARQTLEPSTDLVFDLKELQSHGCRFTSLSSFHQLKPGPVQGGAFTDMRLPSHPSWQQNNLALFLYKGPNTYQNHH